ncbi:hypothetical protein Fmac_013185 [Flemingia macrophylla]|uniref:Uncharacterized protein n=1 Tax=Flemingia macrophylla TaxID=520843 RepID=A0ABD1MSH5_9FABA
MDSGCSEGFPHDMPVRESNSSLLTNIPLAIVSIYAILRAMHLVLITAMEQLNVDKYRE